MSSPHTNNPQPARPAKPSKPKKGAEKPPPPPPPPLPRTPPPPAAPHGGGGNRAATGAPPPPPPPLPAAGAAGSRLSANPFADHSSKDAAEQLNRERDSGKHGTEKEVPAPAAGIKQQKPPPLPAKKGSSSDNMNNSNSNRGSKASGGTSVEMSAFVHENPAYRANSSNSPAPPNGHGHTSLVVVNPASCTGLASDAVVVGTADSSVPQVPGATSPPPPAQHHSRPIKPAYSYSSGIILSKLYDKVCVSETWMAIFITGNAIQFGLLLGVGHRVLPTWAFATMIVLTIIVASCLLLGRLGIKTKRMCGEYKRTVNSPEDESERYLPVSSVYLFCVAAITEGCAFALFAAVVAGNSDALPPGGHFIFNQGTLLQTLRFASISLMFLHRVIRPANRLDPARTMLELEIVNVCWDALDGSTLYQLLDAPNASDLSPAEDLATRILMGVWYLSVGLRLAFMFTIHLPPTNKIYQIFNLPPLALSLQPTVDRTMQALRLRSQVILFMVLAEIYAIILRMALWNQGKLDQLQQEMAIKNCLFIGAGYTAYSCYARSELRDWNSRELGFGFFLPTRPVERQLARWLFSVAYLALGAMLSSFLVVVAAKDRFTWTCNVGTDIVLVLFFLLYCKDVDKRRHASTVDNIASCLMPASSFTVFPGWLGVILGSLLVVNMFFARLPALYYNYDYMKNAPDDSWTSYDNAMLLISCSVVPIALYAQFWSVSFMLYQKEYTACPGNYNAIHDPTIVMVALSTVVEGALDVLSCATLMQLAQNDLPDSVNAAVVVFCILEIVNGCQSFALQGILSGGHEDTPQNLIKWKALLRAVRGVIDLGTFALRMILWIGFKSVSSVFLIKNLYNLLHTWVEVERAQGTKKYPKGTLFTEQVSPQDWYGMSQSEWRSATSDTVVAQAQAGRKV